jgi:serine/threonine-protein kinase
MALSPDACAGTTLGQYKLHEVLGRGAMGVVYRGEHLYLGREVAIKVLRPAAVRRSLAIKWFLREARAAVRISHPGVVQVTDFGKSSDGTVYLVMELIRGETLDVLLARERQLEPARAMYLVLQIADVITAAHRQGIIHRDLKPENVMVRTRAEPYRSGGDGRTFESIKLLDFGVAKMRDVATDGWLTGDETVAGTAEYMAPEAVQGMAVDARSDIYSLGVMLYEMLAGTVPFRGRSAAETMTMAATEPAPALRTGAPHLDPSPELEALLIRALAKRPEDRHASAEEFIGHLRRCRAQLATPGDRAWSVVHPAARMSLVA